SIFQYLTYTTEKPEKNAVLIYVDHYGNYPDALDSFVYTMNKAGFDKSLMCQFVNLYGEVLSDNVVSFIKSLLATHKNNTSNWIKRYIKNNNITFKEFVDQNLTTNEKVAS